MDEGVISELEAKVMTMRGLASSPRRGIEVGLRSMSFSPVLNGNRRSNADIPKAARTGSPCYEDKHIELLAFKKREHCCNSIGTEPNH